MNKKRPDKFWEPVGPWKLEDRSPKTGEFFRLVARNLLRVTATPHRP